ncbi:MAG TPA: DUF4058 family protein [Planctomycetaceae bacterium]|nr:DUF4058 family protein [Planctomycetaceae bacterium]
MKSPFPGMDPWLEAHWGDVHTRLIVDASNQVQRQLPEGLKARVEEYIVVESDDERPHGYYPDVRVTERSDAPFASGGAAAGVAVADPLVVYVPPAEPQTLRRLLIVDRTSGNRLVTVVEILGPANKGPKAGRRAYRRKQQELLAGDVNLVEIDLLRGGSYVLSFPEDVLPRAYRKPYRICVRRAGQPDRAEIYRASFREPLPGIRVPLRETDADVALDLQTMIERAYADGGYDDLDYAEDPVPPLRGKDAEWADQLLREAGRR